MWKICFVEKVSNEVQDICGSPEQAMDIVQQTYKHRVGAFWNNDFEYVWYAASNTDANAEVLAYIENIKVSEDLPVQNMMFDTVEEPETSGRFGLFKDTELWLMYNVLNTTVGRANASSDKLIREIMWEQKMRYLNNVDE
jgi:hypothetical protein